MNHLPRFYKGSDIHITLGAFKDAALEQAGSFEGFGVDVLLYTSDDERSIALSSEIGEKGEIWYPLDLSADGTLHAVIGKELTAELDAGVVRLEVRLTSLATGHSEIAAETAFILIDARISSLPPCMPK